MPLTAVAPLETFITPHEQEHEREGLVSEPCTELPACAKKLGYCRSTNGSIGEFFYDSRIVSLDVS